MDGSSFSSRRRHSFPESSESPESEWIKMGIENLADHLLFPGSDLHMYHWALSK